MLTLFLTQENANTSADRTSLSSSTATQIVNIAILKMKLEMGFWHGFMLT